MLDKTKDKASIGVDIALACYNGMPYVTELIDSIENQTHASWRVIIRDDNSEDQTREVLQKKCNENPKFSMISEKRNLGVIKNFEEILHNTSSDYIMLADQDDYWKPNKINVCLEGIRSMEWKNGHSTPCVFFTDLEVVDEQLQQVHPSFWKYEKQDVESVHKLARVLVRNVAPGCSMIVNRALLEKALPFPRDIIMHDWWLLLIANIFGAIAYSSEATIQYRQHSNNVEGAKRRSLLRKISNFIFRNTGTREIVRITQMQSESLLESYSDLLDTHSRETLRAYCNSRKENALKHKFRCYRAGIATKGYIGNIGLYSVLGTRLQ